MSSIILSPIAAGTASNLTPVPGARPNWECVRDYPLNLGIESYVYAENGIEYDRYTIDTLVATLPLEINSLAIFGVAKRENNTQACSFEALLRSGAFNFFGDPSTLSEVFSSYFYRWSENPTSDIFWTIASVNAIEAGARMTSAGAGCEAQLTQLYVGLIVTVLGEYITNFSPFYKDTIHVDQDYAIVAQEDYGRQLFGATTTNIIYIDPGGVEGTLNGSVIDQNRIIAPMPAVTNNKTGKWRFKLDAILAGGEILEGKEFFVNVQPRWE